MKKSNRFICHGIAFSIVFALSACASSKNLLFTTEAVSSDHPSFSKEAKFTSSGPVSSMFCPGDKTSQASSDLNIGLMDEVIKKAQTESGAKYISQAQFFTQGNCLILEGTAMK